MRRYPQGTAVNSAAGNAAGSLEPLEDIDRHVAERRRSRSVGDWIARRNWPFWVVLLALLIVWELGARQLTSSLILVPPSEILSRGHELWSSGQLAHDMRVSGTEFLLGFILGATIGILVGLLSGSFRTFARIIEPFVSAVYAMPIIALAPLFIIGLGLGLVSKMAVVALTVFFPMLLTTSAGVVATESSFQELGRAFRLSRTSMVTKILVPSAVPHIISGLRVSVGRGLTSVLAAELFGAQAGVGLLILNASNNFDTAGIFVGIAIFAIAGVALTKAFSLLEMWIAPWRQL